MSNNCAATCRHERPYDRHRGDRAVRQWSEALRIAERRAETTGHRQVVRRHIGLIFKRGIWFVQERDEAGVSDE
jgi:hypothetical protein